MELDEKRLTEAFEAIGKTLELMPGIQGTGWGARLEKKAGAVRDLPALVSLLDAGEDHFNFGLALLLRAAAVEPPTSLTTTSLTDLPAFETDTGDFRIHHGDLVVTGDLELEESLIVTGNLEVGGVLDVSPEWLSVLVCGDLRARAASFGKDQVLIGGAFRVETIVAVTEGTVVVGGAFAAGLTIEWRGEVRSNGTTEVKHRFAAEEVSSHARATREKLAAILAPEVFLPEDAGDDVLAVIPRVIARAAKGEAIWRDAAIGHAPTGMPIPPRLAEALEKKEAEVDLSGMRLAALPAEVGRLEGVKKLKLDDNELTDLPPAIGALHGLRELWASSNRLTTLPAEIGALTQLHVLMLPNNKLTELPRELAQLAALENLNLASSLFAELPAAVYSLSKLTRLALSGNPLRVVAAALGDLVNLQTLELGGGLEELPDALARLTKLETFAIVGGALSGIPPSLAKLASIKRLRFQGTKLKAFPEAILDLASLEELSLHDNPIRELPKSFAHLTKLQTLNLSSMELTDVPASIFELPSLKSLYLTDNAIPEDARARLSELAKAAKISIYLR